MVSERSEDCARGMRTGFVLVKKHMTRVSSRSLSRMSTVMQTVQQVQTRYTATTAVYNSIAASVKSSTTSLHLLSKHLPQYLASRSPETMHRQRRHSGSSMSWSGSMCSIHYFRSAWYVTRHSPSKSPTNQPFRRSSCGVSYFRKDIEKVVTTNSFF